MTELTLASLGLNEEALAEKLVDKLAQNLMTSLHYDEDGDEWRGSSAFASKLDAMVKARLDKLVADMAEKHVLPKVNEMVEGMVLQKTNQWGEKVGQPVPFIEYLTQRADAYMQEQVNYEGKPKGDSGGFSWSPKTTRVSYLIEKHLHYSIETAMKNALVNVNSSVAKGLAEATKLAISDVTSRLQFKAELK